MILNHHCYQYYRWKAWVALQLGRPLAQTFFVQWADDELNLQKVYCEPTATRHANDSKHPRSTETSGQPIQANGTPDRPNPCEDHGDR